MDQHLYCLRCADTIESIENNPTEVCDECASIGF